MIEDMNACKLGVHSQRSHIYSCKRFGAFLKRSPDTATPDDIPRFQLHTFRAKNWRAPSHLEALHSICDRRGQWPDLI
jgi:hypothetical protein